MPLETANTIAGLNADWPLGTDPKSQGDDHLRLIKSVLQADAVSKSATTVTTDIVKSGLPAVGWQIAGDVLTIAGTLVTNGAGNGAYTFPKAFKTPPSVVLTPINIFGAPVLDVIMSVTSVGTTGFTVVSQAGNIFTGPVDYGFVALGEALDADKMPKAIQTVGGPAQFANNAEAIAGTATDKVMSPARVAARQGVINSGQLTSGTSFSFTGFPAEATEFDLLLNFVGHGALGSVIALQPNGQNSGYSSSNILLNNGVIGALVTTAEAFGFNAPAQGVNTYTGLVQLRRNGSLVMCSGKLRLTAGPIIEQVGQMGLSALPLTSLLLSPVQANFNQASFNQGEAILRWRV